MTSATKSPATIDTNARMITQSLGLFMLDKQIKDEGTYLATFDIDGIGRGSKELPVLRLVNGQSIDQAAEGIVHHIEEGCKLHPELQGAPHIALEDWDIDTNNDEGARLAIWGTLQMNGQAKTHTLSISIDQEF